MDTRAAHAASKAQSIEALENPGLLGERQLAQLADTHRVEIVQYRPHYDEDDYPDDPLVQWRRGMDRDGVMPKQEVLPPLKPAPTLTADEIEQNIRELLGKLATRKFVDGRIAAKLAEHDEVRLDAHGKVISHERKRVAAEIGRLQETIDRLTSRLDALTHAEVIDLQNPLRSRRA